MSKVREYARLVADRKACRQCVSSTNPARVHGGRHDSDQIGPWSLWQGNLDASLMVVGQDWGDEGYFVRGRGRDGSRNPTNLALAELAGIAGVSIGDPDSREGRDAAFFTIAILCLKDASGGLQGTVQSLWFDNCAAFLRRQVEIVRPSVVVGLGERAYRALLASFNLKAEGFRAAVEAPEGAELNADTRAFAAYHCGARIRNTHRPMAEQRDDRRRIRPFVTDSRRA